MMQRVGSSRAPAARADETRFTDELRNIITTHMQNLGVISAFMCALAANIYVDPPAARDCYGDAGYVATMWLMWVSMGCFFLAISTTVILSSDLSGVPDARLLHHLRRNQALYASPSILTACGLFLMATGYGIDIDERTECVSKWAGVVIAPVFPAALVALLLYTKRRRAALNDIQDARGRRLTETCGLRCGRAWLNAWNDRIPLLDPAARRPSATTDFDGICRADDAAHQLPNLEGLGAAGAAAPAVVARTQQEGGVVCSGDGNLHYASSHG